LVDNSPRTIAASHVLHRLLMPRHPPCALTHLHTTRCSHPLCNTQHTTTPQPHNHHHTQPHKLAGAHALDGQARSGHQEHTQPGVLSGPNSVPSTFCKTGHRVPPSHTHHPHTNTCVDSCPGVESSERRPTNLQSLQAPHPTVRLLRKEVIQPHLPVRLPCYDFVPIASPTFDNSLPQAG
jgi:hypothetical protein